MDSPVGVVDAVGETVAVAVMQKFGVTVPTLFLIIGGATLLVALAIWRTMPKAD